jgi:hypothetical protein
VAIKQKGIFNYLQNESAVNLEKESIFVTITLNKVPGSLIREFALKVACQYPGGMGEAIQELMKNAIKE